MTDLEARMREWLADPDPVKREHAERRIALGFTEELSPPAEPEPEPFDPESARLVLACPHRSPGVNGCQPHACAAGLGDGCSGRFTSWANCLACVRKGLSGG